MTTALERTQLRHTLAAFPTCLALIDVVEHHRDPDVAPLAYLGHHVTVLDTPPGQRWLDWQA